MEDDPELDDMRAEENQCAKYAALAEVARAADRQSRICPGSILIELRMKLKTLRAIDPKILEDGHE